MQTATATKIPVSRTMHVINPVQSTISAMRRGQWVAMFSQSTAMQRIRHVDPGPRGCYRVEWDFGHGTRAHVRIMPGSNPVRVEGAACQP